MALALGNLAPMVGGLGVPNRKPSRPRQAPRWTRPDTVGSEPMGFSLGGGATRRPSSHILHITVPGWPLWCDTECSVLLR